MSQDIERAYLKTNAIMKLLDTASTCADVGHKNPALLDAAYRLATELTQVLEKAKEQR